ncbi:MAG TPA: hypothetical protein VFF67_09060, partial [Thermoplasmata archaeon]|nr:hypothetical protein [Thermoplasmata archaeon]
SVIEGTFGARKARLGSPVRCRRRATQRVEVLCRIVVWNAMAIAYHQVELGGFSVNLAYGRHQLTGTPRGRRPDRIAIRCPRRRVR